MPRLRPVGRRRLELVPHRRVLETHHGFLRPLVFLRARIVSPLVGRIHPTPAAARTGGIRQSLCAADHVLACRPSLTRPSARAAHPQDAAEADAVDVHCEACGTALQTGPPPVRSRPMPRSMTPRGGPAPALRGCGGRGRTSASKPTSALERKRRARPQPARLEGRRPLRPQRREPLARVGARDQAAAVCDGTRSATSSSRARTGATALPGLRWTPRTPCVILS